MKAISLHQPWAHLVAFGHKRIETRSWAPPDAVVGQRIVIHASKTTRDSDRMRHDPIFMSYLPRGFGWGAMAYGCIVATACIVAVEPMTGPWIERVGEVERMFGNFSPGRFGWMLDDVERVAPIFWRGAQGFFDVPDLPQLTS